MSTQNSSSSVLLAFVGGLAAGLAAGFWLNSDRGRKLRNDAVDQMSDLEQRIESKVKEAFSSAKRKAEETMQN